MKKIFFSFSLLLMLCFCVTAAADEITEYTYSSEHVHSFDTWAVAKVPTDGEGGMITSVCAGCGAVEGREISACIELTLWQNVYKLNGEERTMDCTPIVKNDRTMLPIRYVAEGLSAKVTWDANTSTATVKADGVQIEITIGSGTAKVNGKETKLDCPAFIENDRTYMPVRFVAESLGATVIWDAETSQATVTDTGDHAAKILNIPYIYQRIDYPNGCESVSTVMVLRYLGIDIDADTFMDEYLDKGDTPVVGGIGPDPDEVYCGDPHSESGWGCHSPVIVKALNKFMSRSKYTISHAYGKTLDELCKTYIDKDIPVIVWATIGMRNASQSYYYAKWETEDGEQIMYNMRLHCLVLVGYDDENYYFNDPLELNSNSEKYTAYPKSDATTAYNLLYRQSIAIMPK